MRFRRPVGFLVICITLLSLVTTLTGILSSEGPGEYKFESIRGQTVEIYGKGIYQHMSSDVAVQGIAQDYVTLIVGIPLLLVSFFRSGKNSLRERFLLAGTSGYFLVTYLFYMCMAMYNKLFLIYIILTSASFFALASTMFSLNSEQLSSYFSQKLPVKLIGGFLIFNTIAIGLLWLSVILPPLIEGVIYPAALEHYTTLIVQGLDLSFLLPLAFIAGVLFIKKKPFSYLLAPVYMIFLSLLMTALTAKVIGMALSSISTGPAIVVIPLLNISAIICSILIMKNIKEMEFKMSSS